MAQCQGLRAQMVKIFFGLHIYLAGRCSENYEIARGYAQCKSARAIIWLVGETIYCTIFH